jgi:hypothetical protein
MAKGGKKMNTLPIVGVVTLLVGGLYMLSRRAEGFQNMPTDATMNRQMTPNSGMQANPGMQATPGMQANPGMPPNSVAQATPGMPVPASATNNMKPTLVQVRAKLNEAISLMSSMS